MALNSNFRTLTADNIEGVVSTRNYLRNSFENGALAGWTELSVALTNGLPTGTPTISSTAASSLGLSVTSTTPLSLDKSLLVTVPSALTAGQGFISDAFTLDRMDLGKVITVSFDYERVSGTYNFSGTLGSQTWMVYIYDATAGGANWIQPAGFLGMNQSSGPGRVSCTFQSSVVAGQQYRIAVIASQAASGASSIEFDNFTCSRQTAPIGPVVTDWVSYNLIIGATTTAPTPGTVTVNQARWRRVGDSMEIVYNFEQSSAGTSGSGTYLFPIPNGYSVDINKLAILNPARTVVGSAKLSFGLASSGATTPFGVVIIGTSNPNNLIINFPQASIESTGVVGSTAYALSSGAMSYSFEARVPISGWSSQVQLSNDTDTRVVASSYYVNADKAVTSGAAISFDGKYFDTHSAVTLAQGRFTSPVSGVYRVSIAGLARSGTAGNTFYIYKNGLVYKNIVAFYQPDYAISGSLTLELAAGDYIDFRVDGNITIRNGLMASVERLSGPSVVAASETVAMTASASTTSIGNASPTAVVFTNVQYDSHKAYNSTTGVYTIPVSGKFTISGYLYWNNAATGASFRALIYKNSTKMIDGSWGVRVGTEVASISTITINCVAGDTIQIYGFHADGAARALSGGNSEQVFCITRVGN